uniref:Dehydrogenase/reductase SDR family protein 7-like n=1 Tax=Megaselia scalaris TaxID=36166 RepID=T1GMF6_MEGSC
MPDSESSGKFNTFYVILGTLFLPITMPLLVINFLKHLKEKKSRNSLPGKVVVITGASSGLGESLAHSFYKAGAKVVLCARRESELERVKKDLMAKHSTDPFYPPVIVPLDLSELNSLPEAVNKILDIFGHIDILINNGGISVRADIISTAMDVDIKVMLVNYFGAVAMTKAVLPSMLKRQSGRIVFVSSVQGKFALPYRSAYSASKHAMQAFSDSLRAEVANNGIKVTCISPGYINTSLSVNALTASGEQYGKMDETTAGGASSSSMANDIIRLFYGTKKM